MTEIKGKIRRIKVGTAYGKQICVLEPDEKKGYIVTATDLPGVITWGKDIPHAKKMAREAIELCVECLVEKRQLSYRNRKADKVPV